MHTFTIPVGSGRPGRVARKTGNKAKLSPARAGASLSLAIMNKLRKSCAMLWETFTCFARAVF